MQLGLRQPTMCIWCSLAEPLHPFSLAADCSSRHRRRKVLCKASGRGCCPQLPKGPFWQLQENSIPPPFFPPFRVLQRFCAQPLDLTPFGATYRKHVPDLKRPNALKLSSVNSWLNQGFEVLNLNSMQTNYTGGCQHNPKPPNTHH